MIPPMTHSLEEICAHMARLKAERWVLTQEIDAFEQEVIRRRVQQDELNRTINDLLTEFVNLTEPLQ